MNDKIYWLWLMGLKGIGIKKKQCLLSLFKDPQSIYGLDRMTLKTVQGFTEKDLDQIAAGKDLAPAFKTAEYCEQTGIELLTPAEDLYPEPLRNIYLPPLGLFLKGRKALLQKTLKIAMVGSRKATLQGKIQAQRFAAGLACEGVTIVSGLAEGIDGESHLGALGQQGSTIAVMGTGIDRCYPASNRSLYHQIAEKGLLMTEFFPDETALPFHFPMRNRIISGISDGLLVVEAKAKSGAMITVDHALEQGKNVYALPGDIHIYQKAGSNQLIKEGARLVTSPEEILDDYPDHLIGNPDLKKPCSTCKDEASDTLDTCQKRCLRMICEGYDTLNTLALVTGLDIREVNVAVSMLELSGSIRMEQGHILPSKNG